MEEIILSILQQAQSKVAYEETETETAIKKRIKGFTL